MSKDNITESVNTWEDFYQSRVCNNSYVNVFCKKYNRFIEEIIINIQQISYDLKAPLILKEEGCGIGTVSLAISQIGERLFNSFRLTVFLIQRKFQKLSSQTSIFLCWIYVARTHSQYPRIIT